MPRKNKNPLGIPTVQAPWSVKHRGAPGTGGDASVETGTPSYASFINLPNWIRDALNLRADKVPSQIVNPNVIPTLEIFSDGWAFAEYHPTAAATLTVPAPAQIIIPQNAQRNARLMYLNAVHNAAGARTLTVRLNKPGFGAFQMEIIVISIPAATNVQVPIDPPAVICPPDYTVDVISTVVGAEVMTLDWLYIDMPVGFQFPSFG